MSFIKRLMEIKEEQLKMEWQMVDAMNYVRFNTQEILEELKGGKNGKRKIRNKRCRV